MYNKLSDQIRSPQLFAVAENWTRHNIISSKLHLMEHAVA
jgi:hypothetical protein